MYMQETGRAGRDGEPSCAVLFISKSDIHHASPEISHYCKQESSCRRSVLLSYFEPDSSRLITVVAVVLVTVCVLYPLTLCNKILNKRIYDDCKKLLKSCFNP